MTRYVVLLRGINVGGQNKVSMTKLKAALAAQGFASVSAYLVSGNVILESSKSAPAVHDIIEKALLRDFKPEGEPVKVLALSAERFEAALATWPKGFGEQPGKYHSDAIFLMDITLAEAMKAFDPREGVDEVWPGKGVIFHARLSAKRTKTRLNKMMGTPAYKSMTIRSWQTVERLRAMLQA